VVGHDEDLMSALDTADTVIVPSPTVIGQAVGRGYQTDSWHVVPNGLRHEEPLSPPLPTQIEVRRVQGPIRVLARLGVEKVSQRLLASAPRTGRRVDIALGTAPFASSVGAQQRLLTECQRLSERHPDVHIGGGLPWDQVPAWLERAGVVI